MGELGAERDGVRAEHAVHLMYRSGVSYRAVLWRIPNCGWITDEQHKELAAISPTAMARVLGYGEIEPGATETNRDRFRSVAIEAWRAGALTLAELAVVLGVPQRQLRPVLNERRRERSAPPEPRPQV